MIEKKNPPIDSVKFSVQGLGAMGAAVVKYFSDYGAQLTTLSDPKYGGTWSIANGASDALISAIFTQDQGAVSDILKTKGNLISTDPQDALYANTDIVFPCALEDTLTKDNAHKVIAPFICEGANNPTTKEAHTILFENGQIVIPDIIANSGGIIAAYVELTSNISAEENKRTRAKVTEAKNETMQRISNNTRELLDIVHTLNVQPKMVGDYIAYKNLFYNLP